MLENEYVTKKSFSNYLKAFNLIFFIAPLLNAYNFSYNISKPTI